MSNLDEYPPTPITTLTPELTAALHERTQAVLSYLVQTNSISTYFKESEILSNFRGALHVTDSGQFGATLSNPEKLFQTYHDNVPLSIYEHYLPFVSRFFEQPCKTACVENLMAPGLPYFLAHSSGTSGGATKHFPKYRHPGHMSTSTSQTMQASNPVSKHGGKNCVVYSLGYRQVISALEKDGGIDRRMPVCLMSTGTIRMYNNMAVDRDPMQQTFKLPNNSSPLAVSYIPNYKSFLFMHALFALLEPQVELINTMFSTIFRDFCRVIDEQWDTLVDCIDRGSIPELEGIDHVKANLQRFLPPSPGRADELRKIGRAVDTPGWFTKIWPGLRTVVAISSGPFATVVHLSSFLRSLTTLVMVDWQSPAEVAADSVAFTKFMHALLGLYIWEWVTSLDFDWQFISGKKHFRWPLIFYFAGRYCLLFALIGIAVALDVTQEVDCQALYTVNQVFGNASIGLASINLSLRTMAVWSQNKFIVGALVLIILGHWSLLLHGILLQASWIEGTCVITSTDNTILAASFIYSMAFDFVVLVLTGWKLAFPANGRSKLIKLIFGDGLIYFIIAFLSNLLATIFMLLNLNAVMSIIANVPAAIACTIVACRVVRRLTNYTSRGPELLTTTAGSTLAFRSNITSSSRRMEVKKADGVHIQMDTLAIPSDRSIMEYDAAGKLVKKDEYDAEAQIISDEFKSPPY